MLRKRAKLCLRGGLQSGLYIFRLDHTETRVEGGSTIFALETTDDHPTILVDDDNARTLSRLEPVIHTLDNSGMCCKFFLPSGFRSWAS